MLFQNNKMFLRSNGMIVQQNVVLENSLKFRNWMKRKRRPKTTSKSTKFDSSSSIGYPQSSSSSSSENEEKMEKKEDEMRRMRLFVELTTAASEATLRFLGARYLQLHTLTTNSSNLTITHSETSEACKNDVTRAVNRYLRIRCVASVLRSSESKRRRW